MAERENELAKYQNWKAPDSSTAGGDYRDPREVQRSEEFQFLNYLKDLGLTEEQLRDKRILDIGAGDRNFSGHLIRKGITRHAYSAEPFIHSRTDKSRSVYVNAVLTPEQRTVLDQQTRESGWGKLDSPDASFDLIVSRKALPNIEDIDRGLDDVTKLQVGGEMRLFPYFYEDQYDPRREEWMKAMEAKLEQLRQSGKYEVRIERVEGQRKVLLPNGIPETQARLIIKRIKV